MLNCIKDNVPILSLLLGLATVVLALAALILQFL